TIPKAVTRRMKNSPELPRPDLTVWASGNLGIPCEASEREARAAMLRKLAEANFVPAQAVQESFEYWTRPEGDRIFPSLVEQAFVEEENRLRDQVEAFARDFFTLDRDRRRHRHQTLLRQCVWSPPLTFRLEALEPGLDLDLAERRYADAALKELS